MGKHGGGGVGSQLATVRSTLINTINTWAIHVTVGFHHRQKGIITLKLNLKLRFQRWC